MFFLCFIRYLSIWITLQGQHIQSRGIRRSYQVQSCQDFTFGVKLPIVLFLSKPWKPLWNTRALEYFCQRESLKKAWKRFWKEKQMNPRLFRSLWKKLWSQKEVPEPCPGCCAWGHTNSVSAPLPGATESKDLFFFCTLFFAKGNFFDDRRVIFSSSPSDKRLKLLSMQRRFGFPFNLNRQWWKEQWAQHPRDKELKQQFGKVSWPGARGLCLTDELPVVHTSRLGIDMLID